MTPRIRATTTEGEVQRLREEIARLTSRTLELERQLEDLRRERTEVTLNALATTALRAVHASETAMAEEDPERRYVVSRLETTVRGFLAPRGDSVALSLPIPEYAAPPGNVGSLQMTLLRAPAPPGASGPTNTLAEALENAQAAFAAWDWEPGAALARDVTSHLTHGVALHEAGDTGALLRSVHAAAEAAARFGSVIAREVPSGPLDAYGVAADNLMGLTRELAGSSRLAPEDLAAIAIALEQLTQCYLPVMESRRR